jgi:hypothetical protein
MRWLVRSARVGAQVGLEIVLMLDLLLMDYREPPRNL